MSNGLFYNKLLFTQEFMAFGLLSPALELGVGHFLQSLPLKQSALAYALLAEGEIMSEGNFI